MLREDFVQSHALLFSNTKLKVRLEYELRDCRGNSFVCFLQKIAAKVGWLGLQASARTNNFQEIIYTIMVKNVICFLFNCVISIVFVRVNIPQQHV